MGRVDGPVDSKNSVEVIDLVLEQFGKPACRLQRFFRPLFIPEFHDNRSIPADVDQDVGKRETIVPEPECMTTSLGDSRIHQRPMVLKIDVDDLLPYADLRSCDAPAKSFATSEIKKRIAEICDGRNRVRSRKMLYRSAAFAESWIAEKKNFLNGHEINIANLRFRVKEAVPYDGKPSWRCIDDGFPINMKFILFVPFFLRFVRREHDFAFENDDSQ